MQCFLHSCKNSHVCGASDHETVIHFASCTTAPPLRPFLRHPVQCVVRGSPNRPRPPSAPSGGDYTDLRSPSMSRASRFFFLVGLPSKPSSSRRRVPLAVRIERLIDCRALVQDPTRLQTDPIRNARAGTARENCDCTLSTSLKLDGHDARPPDARAANRRPPTIIDTARADHKATNRDARRRRRV